MQTVALGLIAVLVVLVVVALGVLRRIDERVTSLTSAPDDAASDLLPVRREAAAPDVAADGELRVVRDDHNGSIEVWSASFDHYLFRLEQAEHEPLEPVEGLPTWIPRVIESALQQAGGSAGRALPEGALIVQFPKHIRKAIESGALRVMETATGTVAEAVDPVTGHVVTKARVVGKASATGQGAVPGVVGGTGAIAFLPIAAAAAAAFAHQRWLDKTLRRIDDHVLALADRLRDDDHGRLDAAVNASASVEQLLSRGELPDHHRLQMAIAVRDVDAIYLSRRRLLRRFVSQVERAQNRAEERTGEAEAWAKGVDRAFGDPTEFRKEMLVYLHALLARARVNATTAGALAFDGQAGAAFRLVDELVQELRGDFFDVDRRMRALSRVQAGGRMVGSGKRLLHTVTTDLAELMQNEVRPALPPATDEHVTVPIGALPARRG